jgi:hypothetical protein
VQGFVDVGSGTVDSAAVAAAAKGVVEVGAGASSYVMVVVISVADEPMVLLRVTACVEYVMGQTVVDSAMIEVTTAGLPELAGQFMTSGAHEVIVYMLVE